MLRPPTDDSALNMTPMIDIVFQLILFFLFSLRFKSLDHRLDVLLPPRGEGTGPVLDPIPSIRVALHPRTAADGSTLGTRLDLAGATWELPAARDEATEARRQAVKGALAGRIADLHATTGRPGEIRVPPPFGGLVPHGDVMLVLDAFVGANVTDVKFEGARRPLSRR
jgi:hypothetical protein